MKSHVFFCTFLLLTFLSFHANAQERTNMNFPGINGYQTLMCDFHIHTVFSDGFVYPDYRMKEAWVDGIDVLSITDHLEYMPHKAYVDTNRNTAYQIAKPLEKRYGISLIHGTEITRALPFGHYNALFITDAEPINQKNNIASLVEAKKQNAFIFWNHPGWTRPDEIPVWDAVQDSVFDMGLMQGIEIVNEYSYYPLAFQWALDKNLTILANSDAHNPTLYDFRNEPNSHRPMTLVFAKDTSQASVREALFAGRTAAWYRDMLLGRREYLYALFVASVRWENAIQLSPLKNKTDGKLLVISNSTGFTFRLKRVNDAEGFTSPEEFTLYPFSEAAFFIQMKKPMENQESTVIFQYEVTNMLVGPETPLAVPFEIRIGINNR